MLGDRIGFASARVHARSLMQPNSPPRTRSTFSPQLIAAAPEFDPPVVPVPGAPLQGGKNWFTGTRLPRPLAAATSTQGPSLASNLLAVGFPLPASNRRPAGDLELLAI